MTNPDARYRRRYRRAQERRRLRAKLLNQNHDRKYADPRWVRWAVARLSVPALRTLLRYPRKIAPTVTRMRIAHGRTRETVFDIMLGNLPR